jgi:hypothetical protein
MLNSDDRNRECCRIVNKLKQATIENYTDIIDFNNEDSLYNIMFNHFINGDLDDAFSSYELDNIDIIEKRKILSLAREYSFLCFKEKDISKWNDSIEGVVSDNYFVSCKIIDNYNYLIKIIKSGGKEVLELLSSFQDLDEYKDFVIIDKLRNVFASDEILEHTICNMSKDNSAYNVFSNLEKGILCLYPEGTLYYFGKGIVKFTNPLVLACEIGNRIQGDKVFDYNNLNEDSLKDLDACLGFKGAFIDVVNGMCRDYKLSQSIDNSSYTSSLIFALRNVSNYPVDNFTISDNLFSDLYSTSKRR